MSGKIRIGISGWRYVPWRKSFYPDGLVQAKELNFASRALPTIEINGTFYGQQMPSSYSRWYEDTPADFVFSVKGPKFITHVRRLEQIDKPLANFFASGLFHLKEKLGPILWQFPPTFKFEPALFESFLKLLPHDSEAALKLAKQREPWMQQREYLLIDSKCVIRHAVEIRNESFVDPDFVKLLRKYKVALVIADTAGKWPYREDVTADFIYMRLHGAEELYASGYTDAALERWAKRIDLWSKGAQPKDAHVIANLKPSARKSRDVFCYFDNDIKVKAPFDARKLLRRLGLEDGLTLLSFAGDK